MYSDRSAVPAVPVKVTAALCAALLLSCSVKEDRTGCPCFLTLDFGGLEAAGLLEQGLDSLVLAVGAGKDFYAEEGFALKDHVQEYSLEVPKSLVDVLAVCGAGRAGVSPEGFMIPEGSACPALYRYTESFFAEADGMRRTVAFHKEHCMLTVSLKASPGVTASRFRIRLEGNVAGFRMDGSPADGHFNCFSSLSAGGLCHLNVPRQKDASLRLFIEFPDSGELRSFPVGKYILESGYDWRAQDLEDVSVEVDFSRSNLTVSTSRWQKTLNFEITF